MKETKVVIAHPGTQHALKLAKELSKQGYLDKYISTLVWSDSDFLIRLIKKIFPRFYILLSNRLLDEVPKRELKVFPLVELQHKINKFFRKKLTDNDLYYSKNKRFQQALKYKQIVDADIIIGFDTASWILIDLAKKNRKLFILDQSIGHSLEMVAVHKQLNAQYPSWSKHIIEKKDHLLKRERFEYDKADYIVVASTFTKETLIKNGINEEKIFLNPYGVDLIRFHYDEREIKQKKIFLFVGTVDVRKGIPFLLQCWNKANLPESELWIVGPVADEIKERIAKVETVKVFGKIINAELSKVMRQAHVFVFPSFFEGFGLVILEAMASGLPVVTTAATAGADLIENGKEGFVITPGDEEQLIRHLKYFSENPEQIVIMGKHARFKAEQYSWQNYGIRWEEIINKVTKGLKDES
jgi:alpha-maltose-1-phosphate synthase